MRLFQWSPTFDFTHEPVPVWFKIHALPSQWFDLRTLKTIGGLIGTFVKADPFTLNRSRLNFARLCVIINLEEFRPDKINILVDDVKTVYDIEFEKIPKYCQHCKHIGHAVYECYILNPTLKPAVFTNKNFEKKDSATKPASTRQKKTDADGFVLVGNNGKGKGKMDSPGHPGYQNNFHILSSLENDDENPSTSQVYLLENGPEKIFKTPPHSPSLDTDAVVKTISPEAPARDANESFQNQKSPANATAVGSNGCETLIILDPSVSSAENLFEVIVGDGVDGKFDSSRNSEADCDEDKFSESNDDFDFDTGGGSDRSAQSRNSNPNLVFSDNNEECSVKNTTLKVSGLGNVT
ncbi:hypothetical protein OROMI_014860 [Orobanche minor]